MDYGPARIEVGGREPPHVVALWNFPSVGLRLYDPAAACSETGIPSARRTLRMSTAEDRQWLEQARAGDRVAFGKLIRQHQQRIHRLALHLTGNAGEADDITQETFLRAYRAISRFDGRADLFTWLYRICVNVSLNLRRQRKRVTTDIDDPRVPEPVSEQAGSDPALAAQQAQAYRSLTAAMDGLSEVLRTTLVMACVDQIPYAEIARILECSEGTVAWRVHEARRKLRDALGDDVIDGLESKPAMATRSGDADAKKGGSRGRRT
jgi:RNA polymerase sigma-70 factor (ECF subfamily)